MRSDGVSETLPREQADPAGAVVRRLAYSDLPAVISIERRSFPTPWSLAMFVLELSKPSGICLAATEGDRLLGYLVCSRYDRVWHLMNVAVAPEHRRAGVARRLIARLVEEGEASSPSRSRSGPPIAPRSRCTNGSASAPPACAPATTRTTARTR